MNNEVLSNTWEQARYKSYKFPIVAATERFDISRVHPRMQAKSIDISIALENDERVTALVLFGSATNIRCNKDSDFDVLVVLDNKYRDVKSKSEISEVIQNACDWRADILWSDQISENNHIYKHILKGVQIL